MNIDRPPDGRPVDVGTLLMLWLDSIPCVSSGCRPPQNAPLTPEEADQVSAYLAKRKGPAAAGEARRRAQSA